MVGWFGVQNAVFGQGMAEIVPFTDFLGTQEILPGIMAGITPEYIFWAIITGLGITLLVVFGIKAIANFATVFVPLFVIVVIVAAAIILQNHSLTELLTTAPPDDAHRHVRGRVGHEPACSAAGARHGHREYRRHHDGHVGHHRRHHRSRLHGEAERHQPVLVQPGLGNHDQRAVQQGHQPQRTRVGARHRGHAAVGHRHHQLLH